jgi:hypothetical protein
VSLGGVPVVLLGTWRGPALEPLPSGSAARAGAGVCDASAVRVGEDVLVGEGILVGEGVRVAVGASAGSGVSVGSTV